MWDIDLKKKVLRKYQLKITLIYLHRYQSKVVKLS